MSEMVNKGEVGTTVDGVRSAVWSEHIQGAVSEFLKTAVVIDNQPWVRDLRKQSATVAVEPAVPAESGLGDEHITLLEPPETAAITDDHLHDLDLRAISDAFSSQGVACAFVLPDDEDTETSNDQKIERAVAAAKISDLVVIDWYLANKSESLTLNILEKIAESDAEENGRLRLICVYTGEPINENIFNDTIKALQDGGVAVQKDGERDFYAAGENTLVAIFNKYETRAQDLPCKLIELFSHFANGLIPAFSLAAVGAIRKNAHHMLTRFGKILDAAYIANRIITNPPGDVSEMMRDLFVSECDSALGLEKVADRYLEADSITLWLNEKENLISPVQMGALRVDKALLQEILRNGVKDDKDFNGDDGRVIRMKNKDRHFISAVLAGSAEASKVAEHELARLVILKREAYGRSKLKGAEAWRPSLTTGTLLKFNPKNPTADSVNEYLICLTPACDTLRLRHDTPFVFLQAKIDLERYGLVLKEEDGNDLFLRIDHKRPFIRTFSFSPEENLQRVLGVKSQSERYKFNFVDVGENEFSWLGEIRNARAASEMAGLLQNWMRIGVNDSEYLRLTKEGVFNP